MRLSGWFWPYSMPCAWTMNGASRRTGMTIYLLAWRAGWRVTVSPHPSRGSRLATLSEREREVLDRILEGKQTRQITDELCISVKTVEFHRARIREKLGVATQAQLFSLFIASEDDA